MVEVTATLARKRKTSSINYQTFEQQNQAVTRDWYSFVQIRCTDEIIDAARMVARTEALRGADSIHLASALHLKQRLDNTDQVIFITSDHELATAAKSQGLAVVDPVEQEPNDQTTGPS